MTTTPLKDLSGRYKCTINDAKDGIFTVINVFTLDKKNSTDKIAGYQVTVESDGNALSYTCFASFDGETLALYGANKDTSTENGRNDYAIIIGKLTKDGFNTVYYQPTYQGGNTGSAVCIKI